MLTWRNVQGGPPYTGDLELVWEVNGDPISDDYAFEDISAVDLLRRWLEKSYPDPVMESLYGPGVVRIHWYVASRSGNAAHFESAPFQPDVWRLDQDEHDFLTFYTWPTDVESGERLSFNSLPVIDKVWTADRWDKGGFIQTATGWKPSAMQPVMHVPTVLAAAGLGHLAPLTERQRGPLYDALRSRR